MTNFTDIRDFLRAHCARYPELALQDVFKALYQSAFGCEHLIADPSAAADYIRAEAARSGDRISELVELLGGDYCRVHLGILQDGLSAETFARLFALSARHEECGREKLEAMLTALQTMADAGELPFSAQETAEAVERWRKDGFPPLHHSEIFRQKNSASASSNGMRPRMQSSFSTAGSLSSSAISTRSMCGTAAISSFRRTIK